MKRITNGFDKLSLADFRQKVDFILACMTNNPLFASLQADVQALATAMAAYKLLDDAAAGRDRQAIIKRDQAWEKLLDALHLLGNDITALAKNDEAILAASGFPYTQPKKNTPDISKPDNLRVEAGINKGEITCTISKQPGVISFNFYWSTDPNASTDDDTVQWTVLCSNRVKETLTGLASGVRYYIKVGLVGVRRQEVFSDVVSYIPQ